MNNKVKARLRVLLSLLAVILLVQVGSIVWAEKNLGDQALSGSEEVSTQKEIPESGEKLAAYIKDEIAAAQANGAALSNDELTELFMACDAEGYVHLTKEGAAYIMAKDGSELMLGDLASDYVSRITSKTLEQLLEIGETYVAHAKDLKYGNIYTPFNASTTNHIDCSSFVQLSLYGIPYETSRYASADDSNTARYDFGLSLPDNPYSNTYGPERYLANQLAKYAFDNDFGYYPNADATNLQPGDVVFFSTNKNNEDYFLNITHTAIFVERQEDDLIFVLHGNSYDVANYYQIRLSSPLTPAGSNNPYKDALVFAARFPILSQD